MGGRQPGLNHKTFSQCKESATLRASASRAGHALKKWQLAHSKSLNKVRA